MKLARTAFLALTFAIGMGLSGPLWAVEPDEILDDPVLESRARDISLELRCLVCQNQSIDDSNAELAKEMRLLVRERLLAGDSDKDVKDYLVSRYGDYVLLRPPVKPSTYLLWLSPVFLVLLALPFGWRTLRKRKNQPVGQPLTAAERERLDALLKDDDTRSADDERNDGGSNDGGSVAR